MHKGFAKPGLVGPGALTPPPHNSAANTLPFPTSSVGVAPLSFARQGGVYSNRMPARAGINDGIGVQSCPLALRRTLRRSGLDQRSGSLACNCQYVLHVHLHVHVCIYICICMCVLDSLDASPPDMCIQFSPLARFISSKSVQVDCHSLMTQPRDGPQPGGHDICNARP